MGFAAPCAVRPGAQASITASCRQQINHDLFYVAYQSDLETLRKKPYKFADKLTDPVTRTIFHPTKKSPRYDFEGRPYLFSSDSTRTVFKANPSMYAVPPESMSRSAAADSTHAAATPDSSRSGTPAADPGSAATKH